MRSAVLPNVPTVSESGVPGLADVNVTGWFGLAAPPETPPAVVDLLYSSAAAVLTRDDVKARLANLSAVPIASTPAQFAAVLAKERAKWQQVIAAGKIEAE